MDYEDKFEAAKTKVRAKVGFYKHTASFVAGNGVLVGVDLLTTPGFFWFYWPCLGWALALGVHATMVSRAGKREY